MRKFIISVRNSNTPKHDDVLKLQISKWWARRLQVTTEQKMFVNFTTCCLPIIKNVTYHYFSWEKVQNCVATISICFVHVKLPFSYFFASVMLFFHVKHHDKDFVNVYKKTKRSKIICNLFISLWHPQKAIY